MSDSRKPASILVVDDDEATRVLVSGLLHREGYAVQALAGAEAALAAAAASPPDLILLDIMLPDGDGLGVCTRLRDHPSTRDVPVIFLTARGACGEVVRGFEVGGVDYIVKPFEVPVLLARVATHTTLARLSRGLKAALDERAQGLKQANRRLRKLNVEMALVEERERRRLAQALHDTTIQQLVLARIVVEAEDDGQRRRAQLTRLLDESLAQLRTLVFKLSPPVLSRAGLWPAIEWLGEQIAGQWGLAVSCSRQGSGAAPPLSDALALTLFQGTRELLINVAKHAEATRADVTVTFAPTGLAISVADDGRGFDPRHLAGEPPEPAGDGGFGLYSLCSRIELLGGRLVLGNGPRRGALVRIEVPLHPLGEAADDQPGSRRESPLHPLGEAAPD